VYLLRPQGRPHDADVEGMGDVLLILAVIWLALCLLAGLPLLGMRLREMLRKRP